MVPQQHSFVPVKMLIVPVKMLTVLFGAGISRETPTNRKSR